MSRNELPVYPTPGERHELQHPHKTKVSHRSQANNHSKPIYRPPQSQGYQNGNVYSQAPIQGQAPPAPTPQQYFQSQPAPQKPVHGYQQPQQMQPPPPPQNHAYVQPHSSAASGHYYQQSPQSHPQATGGQYYQSQTQPPSNVNYQTSSYTQAPPPQDHYAQQQLPPQQQYGHAQPLYQNQSHSPSYDSFRDSGSGPSKRPQNPSGSGSSIITSQTANRDPYRQKNRSKESLESSSLSSKQRLENELRVMFDKVDINRSGSISPRELSSALLNFDHTRFQDSTIILMINLFTSPEQPKKSLTFEQFVSLWKYLAAYKKLFVAADADRSGDISFGEFQKILEQIGYKLEVDLVLLFFHKFSNKNVKVTDSTSNMAIAKLKFDAFIELLVYLRKLTDVFKKYDKDLKGVATINFSEFLTEVSNLS
ncbi:hypothetical protein CLIB1423_05S05974 [[Candida] railenensis]|uniref:EF-hand domain-containing protein n=1 Tax=[Candida] railenensis TaxID=45579 RepID=A0A9P0VXP5_9ASCO|nr:hypothetical protein CLIB1423_05S05974 [[Candida] railenensis]